MTGDDDTPRVLVLRTAGTNCDQETARGFQLAGWAVEVLHVGVFLRGQRTLDEFHGIVFPGGFSYGDDLGAGTVLANQLRAHLADKLSAFVESGRLVLGICNGFQVLVRLGLLPGWLGEPAVALVENHSARFEDRWVNLRVETARCAFLQGGNGGGELPTLRLPVAHKEGRFVVRDPAILERLEAGGHVALRYTTARGVGMPAGGDGVRGDVAYPANPNGSDGDIAGIMNAEGNVLGLMPHPERHLRRLHDPQWTRRRVTEGVPADEVRAGDGFLLFRSAYEHARGLSVR